MKRVYLDWNATAPLRPEARAAMIEAMDAVGNPSSIHAEGRAARLIVEGARVKAAALLGADPEELVFTSGATEAVATMLLHTPWDCVQAGSMEHDCVYAAIDKLRAERPDAAADVLDVDAQARCAAASATADLVVISPASGETGVLQDYAHCAPNIGGELFADATQIAGRAPAGRKFRAHSACVSAHKIGGPKGVGALASRCALTPAYLPGGGHERGRRSGTENVIGLAGFGAAAAAALRDVEAGAWEALAQLRDKLEEKLKDAAPELIVIGETAARLPNTSCFAVPGWRGETQVIQMDLAGFAISAGSACSSGKVKASRALLAMGYEASVANSAVRVSIGPTTQAAELDAFAAAWIKAYTRWRAKRV